MGYRIQGAKRRWGARRVSDAVGIRRVVRKRDCTLPAQDTKHSNARGTCGGSHYGQHQGYNHGQH